MDITVVPLAPALGAEITGLRLDAPLAPAVVRAVYDAWLRFHVLVFRDQDLSSEDQRRFTGYFGDPQDLTRTAPEARVARKEVMYIGNVTIDGVRGDLPDGEMQFHTDGAYFERPTKATLLYGVHVPPVGGDTLFSNGFRAYDGLDAALRRRIDGLEARNVYDYRAGGTQRNLAAAVDAPRFVHPVVIRHPETGQKALYVSRLMTTEILGLPQAESDALLGTLFAAVERPELVYAHQWRPRDLVVWDNRGIFHARTWFDPAHRRALRRMTVKGERPTNDASAPAEAAASVS